jgi:hypothetical protein
MLLLLLRIVPRDEFDLLKIIDQKRRLAAIRAATRAIDQRQTSRARAASGVVPVEPGEEALSLRAAVAEAVAREDWAGGHAALLTFLAHVGDGASRLSVSRRVHLSLANGLFQCGKHPEAEVAYARFLHDHPADAEVPHVRLMLALIRVRYTARPLLARPLLLGLETLLADPDDQEILKSLRAEIPADKA